MKVITAGHKYELNSLEGTKIQTLQFIEKIKKDGDKLITLNDGTSTEEVIIVLIDRLEYLQSIFPCKENEHSLTKLTEALMWLNKRTDDRKRRDVEGKAKL